MTASKQQQLTERKRADRRKDISDSLWYLNRLLPRLPDVDLVRLCQQLANAVDDLEMTQEDRAQLFADLQKRRAG